MEPSRPGGDAAKGNSNQETAQAAAPLKAAGGLQTWLPLIVTTITMPLVAYATTAWVLAPQLERAAGKVASEPAKTHTKGAKNAQGESVTGKKVSVPLKKVLVNVRDTAGTRYLLTNMSLVGYGEEFKTLINEHVDQLADLASSTLANKTISDLEKPGIRNLIRTELITVFNNALGSAAVQEIYLIDFAIQ
jgi:flagellar basal body-associated protein FliL